MWPQWENKGGRSLHLAFQTYQLYKEIVWIGRIGIRNKPSSSVPSSVGSVIRKFKLWLFWTWKPTSTHLKPDSLLDALQQGRLDAEPGTVWLMSHDLAALRGFWELGNTLITFLYHFFCNLSHLQEVKPHQIALGSKGALSHAQQPIKKPLQCCSVGCSWCPTRYQCSS